MATTRFLQAGERSSLFCRLLGISYHDRVDHLPQHAYASYAGSYYDVLELTPHASQAQIKAAYYRLSKKYHPDVASEIRDAKEKFGKLSIAYEVLGNPRTRRMYDNGILGSDIGSGSGTEDNVDVEYREFLRRRGTFRARQSGQAHTGRSPMFDFDEFYRQHYGDSIKDSQKTRQNKASMEEHEAWHLFERNRNIAVYASAIILSVITLVLTGRVKKF